MAVAPMSTPTAIGFDQNEALDVFSLTIVVHYTHSMQS